MPLLPLEVAPGRLPDIAEPNRQLRPPRGAAHQTGHPSHGSLCGAQS